jgi:hypothetical protein
LYGSVKNATISGILPHWKNARGSVELAIFPICNSAFFAELDVDFDQVQGADR